MRAMAAFLFRLIALLSVALMPIGMSAAAAAQPAGAHHSAGASAAAHCASQDEPDAPPAPMDAECMACAGLAPSFAPAAAERLVPRAPLSLTLAHVFAGIDPEIATPPPKRA